MPFLGLSLAVAFSISSTELTLTVFLPLVFALRFLLAQAMRTVDAQLATLQGHTGEVESVEFSFDEKFVITASSDKTAKIWKIPDGKLVVMSGNMLPDFSHNYNHKSDAIGT